MNKEAEQLRNNATVELSQLFKQLRIVDALDEVKDKTPRQYKSKEPLRKLKPAYARFKIWVQYKDGGKAILYSFDNIHGSSGIIIDEWEGFKKFLVYVNKNQSLIARAIIYATLDPQKDTNKQTYDYQICSFDQYGNKKVNGAGMFVTHGKNVYLDLRKLEVHGNKIIK
jgi:hypothetical protein